jgi:penicillin amidase
VAQVSGTLEVIGLSAPVRIARDRWGVPHIYAQSQDDLFVAQGFVQAQDRLFQMDLWRRSVQGRLSQVLGSNFIERDAMTRRVQYVGDLDREWASYGPDAKAIATAFVRGVNAWVARAREVPPDEFVLAGWKPDFWLPVDLLNRTDAFRASGNAIEEATKRSPVIGDAIRRVGVPPFFLGLAGPVSTVRLPPSPEASGEAQTIRALDHPSRRYLVHLNAPGWNVIGATAPWLPGVAIGHNDRVAWNLSDADVDTQDVYVEKVNPANPHQVWDDRERWVDTSVVHEEIVVLGRTKRFAFDREFTAHGVIVAIDSQEGLAFTVRWSGAEPGAAGELGALALDRAGSWTEFRAALGRWKMPARRVAYADVDGAAGFQVAALVPVRRPGEGVAPKEGWTGLHEWRGWRTLDDLPHEYRAGPGAAETTPAGDGRPRGSASRVVFAHPLAVTEPSRQRFNIGPLTPPASGAAPFHATFDPADWDRSRVVSAPGQSGSADSAHFSDFAKLWAAGENVALVFSEKAVQANTETTLTLVPAGTSQK